MGVRTGIFGMAPAPEAALVAILDAVSVEIVGGSHYSDNVMLKEDTPTPLTVVIEIGLSRTLLFAYHCLYTQ